MGQPSSGIGVRRQERRDPRPRSPTRRARSPNWSTATGLPRATAHRLAVALEVHRLLARDADGRFVLGPRVGELAARAARSAGRRRPGRCSPGCATSAARARSSTGATARERVCVAAAERAPGLRTTVPVGSRLPLTAGSGAQVLCAWSDPAALGDVLAAAEFTVADARRGAPARLGAVGRRSARRASRRCPRRCSPPSGALLAAISISGPIERLGRTPGRALRARPRRRRRAHRRHPPLTRPAQRSAPRSTVVSYGRSGQL